MDKKDTDKFLNLMSGLASLFDKELSPIASSLYFQTLKKYTLKEIEFALNRAAETCEFFPRPVNIINFIEGDGVGIEALSEQQAAIVIENIAHTGGYQTVQFEDTVTNQVIVSMGGWPEVCKLKAADKKWFRIEFKKLYSAFKKSGRKYCNLLPGIHETENSAKGYGTPDNIVMIDFKGTKKEVKQIEQKTNGSY